MVQQFLSWDKCFVFPVTWLVKLHSPPSLSPKPCYSTLTNEPGGRAGKKGMLQNRQNPHSSQASLICVYRLLQIRILCWKQLIRNTLFLLRYSRAPKILRNPLCPLLHKRTVPFLTEDDLKLQVMKTLRDKSWAYITQQPASYHSVVFPVWSWKRSLVLRDNGRGSDFVSASAHN